MTDNNVLDTLIGALGAVDHDHLTQALDAIGSSEIDLSTLSHDQALALLASAISTVAAVAAKSELHDRPRASAE